jgi:hypothetical protein
MATSQTLHHGANLGRTVPAHIHPKDRRIQFPLPPCIARKHLRLKAFPATGDTQPFYFPETRSQIPLITAIPMIPSATFLLLRSRTDKRRQFFFQDCRQRYPYISSQPTASGIAIWSFRRLSWRRWKG